MLPTLSAAAARAALRRLAVQSIQRRWIFLRQISTVQIPSAPPPAPPNQSSSLLCLRTYARMARRIPPVRPDYYSDCEPDKEENEQEEMDVAQAQEERGDETTEWKGWMFDFGSKSDEDSDSDPAEVEEDNNK